MQDAVQVRASGAADWGLRGGILQNKQGSETWEEPGRKGEGRFKDKRQRRQSAWLEHGLPEGKARDGAAGGRRQEGPEG